MNKRGSKNRSIGFIETSIPPPIGKGCLGPAQVSALAGVNADLFAFIDEGWDLDNEAGFKLGGLGDAGCSGRLQARLGLHDFQLNRRRKLDAYRVAIVVADLDL